MKTKIIFVGTVGLALIVGLGIGRFLVNTRSISQEAYQKGYNDAWNKVKNLLEEKLPMMREPKEIRTLTGEVLAVSTNFLKIKVEPLTINPLSDLYRETIRTVNISGDTQIVKRIMKLPGEMKQGAIFPAPFKEEDIKLSEIKKGDRVMVEAQENILTKEEFTGKKISLLIR